VLCSSRTRAELEIIQQEFHFRHPFISENGGAVYLPRGYFSPSAGPADMSGYDVITFAGRHQQVVEILRRTAEAQAIEVRAFNGMSVQEVADECGLTRQRPVWRSSANLASRSAFSRRIPPCTAG
jgi:mannosyl-3-phosphoglycerate phosphatase